MLKQREPQSFGVALLLCLHYCASTDSRLWRESHKGSAPSIASLFQDPSSRRLLRMTVEGLDTREPIFYQLFNLRCHPELCEGSCRKHNSHGTLPQQPCLIIMGIPRGCAPFPHKFVSRSFGCRLRTTAGVGWRNILRRQQRGLVGEAYLKDKGSIGGAGDTPLQ